MKIFKSETTFDAGKRRIEWLFNEFDEVVVSFSGGKDSTVILNLALMVAEKLGRLPVKVMWLDQEAEWQSVVDYAKEVFSDPRVEPMWFQVPFKMFNATSAHDEWLNCWGEGEEWMRPQEGTHTENIYGSDRFHALFPKIIKTHFPDSSVACLVGIRTQESPSRFIGTTSGAVYKGETWAKRLSKKHQHFNFSPIYDWCYTDVWKSIHDHNWAYSKVYDYQYMHGCTVSKMRVSSLHHETSIASLMYLQEVEAETWVKLTRRLSGINTAGKIGDELGKPPKELPYMFSNWFEYRDYLLANLILDEEHRFKFSKRFAADDETYKDLRERFPAYVPKIHIRAILLNDYHMTTVVAAFQAIDISIWRKATQKGKEFDLHVIKKYGGNKYLDIKKY